MKCLTVEILEDEYWWGGSVKYGHEMPICRNSELTFDLCGEGDGEADQFAPFLLSSKGRYIWSEEEFRVDVKNGVMTLT